MADATEAEIDAEIDRLPRRSEMADNLYAVKSRNRDRRYEESKAARKAKALAEALRPILTVVRNDHPPAPRPLPADTEAMATVDPFLLDLVPIPERDWIIPDWLGVGYVTGQYGDGGVGKGMTAQALQTATASGTAWLGYAVTPCRSIGLYCEDDSEELHRRQDRINRATGVSFCDLEPMRWVTGVGHDNTFCTFDRAGEMTIHDRYHQIVGLAREQNAKLIVLDNVADLFGGNENDRNQVRRFINLLNRLALDRGAAILLNCHPSRAGLASGSLDGGSTAWSNSMRSRWTIARIKGDDGTDSGERLLSRAKANYAPDGGTIRLRWESGALVPVARPSGASASSERYQAEYVFLTLLDRCGEQNVFVSESRNATNYAPKVFAARPDREGINRKQFETAMAALFADRKITIEDYMRCRKPCRRIARQAAP
ncbi:AAA family ATPase [Acidiphilium sp. 34-64-41]|uniref:AAA family ATPase n=1 Tax=Acidiphilium sp. 34-64-41 TaxID=1970297 RepID=UPI002580C94C|nr:AAA family ATPase [Acidiphilium sp. 34-64-41]